MVLMMVCIGSSSGCGGGGGGDAVAGNQVVIVVGRMPGFTERRYLFISLSITGMFLSRFCTAC